MGRANKNVMRNALKPGPICVDSKDKPSGIKQVASRQHNFAKTKNTAPNYPKKDPNIVYTKEI